MAQITINNGDSALTVRESINDNFTELYTNSFDKSVDDATDINIVDSEGNFTATTVEGALAEVFTGVSNSKSVLETTITDKGGTVSKVGEVATFPELNDGINSIPTGGGEISAISFGYASLEQSSTVAGTYYTLLDVSGAGWIDGVSLAGYLNNYLSIRITIDGGTPLIFNGGSGIYAIGYFNKSASISTIATNYCIKLYQKFYFGNSLKIEVSRTLGSGIIYAHCLYSLTNDSVAQYLSRGYNLLSVNNSLTNDTYTTVLDVTGSGGFKRISQADRGAVNSDTTDNMFLRVTIDGGTPIEMTSAVFFSMFGETFSTTYTNTTKRLHYIFSDYIKFNTGLLIEVKQNTGSTFTLDTVVEYYTD